MKYTKAQLIDALVAEWEYLCHDDYDPEDQTPEEYREDLIEMTLEELVEETSTGEGYTLDLPMGVNPVYIKRVKGTQPCT
jgi:hypothetical protein